MTYGAAIDALQRLVSKLMAAHPEMWSPIQSRRRGVLREVMDEGHELVFRRIGPPNLSEFNLTT
jgi:hypothetical protein